MPKEHQIVGDMVITDEAATATDLEIDERHSMYHSCRHHLS